MKRRHTFLNESGSMNFITTTVVRFLPLFKNEALAKIMLDAMILYTQKYRIHVHGFVIMPNHMHMLITAEDQRTVSQFMGKLKEQSAKEIIKWCIQNNEQQLLTVFAAAAAETKEGHKYQIWQKRFDNVAITNPADMRIKLDYIHNNPLQERWQLCTNAEDYHFSSAAYYMTGKDTGIPITKIEH